MSRIYGFYDECRRHKGLKVWKDFCRAFNWLPVCALVNQRIFCVHGGISPELKDLNQIRHLERPVAVPESGLLCDLLWSDPEPEINGWGENDRGVSFVWGQDVAKQCLSDLDLDFICRSHQAAEDGYKFFAGEKVVTLWSIRNFRGFDEMGAVMRISEDGERSFEQLKTG